MIYLKESFVDPGDRSYLLLGQPTELKGLLLTLVPLFPEFSYYRDLKLSFIRQLTGRRPVSSFMVV